MKAFSVSPKERSNMGKRTHAIIKGEIELTSTNSTQSGEPNGLLFTSFHTCGWIFKVLNRIPVIRYFEGCAEIFSLAKQRVNFMQKELAKRNICTNFGTSKRDIQQVKITHALSQRGIELRTIHSGFYSGVNRTSRSI
jgi:hypothetical protein